ncbi:unnamed protein product [Paramecium octaurelia]|uniref:Uncharacterized protein n=1 Tax=Paramecium octaurelia TaxID=43137 RepID=A0A8S1V8B8_PAROT|nr:unnamed protein product [Paramecium octaurelia]
MLYFLGLSTTVSLFISLDQEYNQQCPSQMITLLSDLSLIPIVEEGQWMLVSIIKRLPSHFITALIWSQLMLTTAIIVSIMYLAIKVTYSFFLYLAKYLLILFWISVFKRHFQDCNIK